MQSSMQKYKKRMLTLSIMLLVIVLLSGVSYAIFTNYASQTDANTLAASCMDLEKIMESHNFKTIPTRIILHKNLLPTIDIPH